MIESFLLFLCKPRSSVIRVKEVTNKQQSSILYHETRRHVPADLPNSIISSNSSVSRIVGPDDKLLAFKGCSMV